jgi:hypothetical protein
MNDSTLFTRAEISRKKRSQYTTYYYHFLTVLFIMLATAICLSPFNRAVILQHTAYINIVKGLFFSLIIAASVDPALKPYRSSDLILRLVESHDKRAVPYLLDVIAPERNMAYRRTAQKAALNELLDLLPNYTEQDAVAAARCLIGPLTRIISREESNVMPLNADLLLHCVRLRSYLSSHNFRSVDTIQDE